MSKVILILCGLAAIEYHFYALRIVQVDALLNANERILEIEAKLWHCEHQRDACLSNRKEF